MSCRRNFLLRLKNISTFRTVASFCLSRCLASRCYICIFNYRMSGSRNFFLGFEHSTTDRAMASLGFSCCFTGRCYTFINHHIMFLKRNLFFIKLSAKPADHLFQAGFCAGCRMYDRFFIRMVVVRIIIIVHRCMVNIIFC